MFVDWLFENYPTWMLFAELILCGAAVVIAGARLTEQADAICDQWGLGRAWVGLLLLAGITSLPELVVGSTGVMLGQPDLSMGNILGSCCFNVAIISLLTAVGRPKDAEADLEKANPAHMLSSSFGIFLISTSILMIAVVQRLGAKTWEANVAEWVFAALLGVSYVVCMRLLYTFERRFAEAAAGDVTPGPKTNHLLKKFVLSAVLIVAAAIWLTRTGDVLQEHPMPFLPGGKLGGTFVGLFFLAIATSLPEIVTCFAAVRIGRVDMALGNIFGSNMFNIFVIPLLKVISAIAGHNTLLGIGGVFDAWKSVFAGMLAILLTGVAIAGLVYRAKRGVLRFGFDSALIAVLYVAGMYFMLMY